MWRAPGRVNLIGEHTDYNDGLVLPIAVPLVVTCAARPTTDGVVRVVSVQRPGERIGVPVGALTTERDRVPDWARYPVGVVAEFVRRGHRVDGVELRLDGQVPIGAGLSSSAALCCSVAVAIRDLYTTGVGDRELIDMAQAAENEYVGVPTGVLDHAASLLCTAGHALFLDVRRFRETGNAGYEHIPFDLPRHGLSLLVIDTGQPHRLADGGYARRRAECAAAADALGVAVLRDAELTDVQRLDDSVLRRRARHVVTENERVRAVADLLRGGADPRETGPLLRTGHISLRDDFDVSTPALDTAVDAALTAGAYGARMVGGGFGGSVIALVDDAAADKTGDAVRAAFARADFAEPRISRVIAAAGAVGK
ncbi:galactokinase [Nocardia donostiensis]|uniref:Galactokinase n=1 Tax=Nocardia donostiensis TaxID=1538463 RepID=A0A1W0AUG4_9NOCA|nr:galactokinase [Nocardia donostiensis]OQS13883.1 galactokinase [Nocardia donostiensis]OQS20358.1 galactokinase [Nocardia donostiensis]